MPGRCGLRRNNAADHPRSASRRQLRHSHATAPASRRIGLAGVASIHRWSHPEVKDSKKFTGKHAHARRHALAREIESHCLTQLATASAAEIDRFGIKRCLQGAVQQIIHRLGEKVAGWGRTYRPAGAGPLSMLIVLDGADFVAADFDLPAGCELISVPKADDKVFEVAAASIVAKAYRDGWAIAQCEADGFLKQYQIERNMGYLSAAHQEAIKRHGPHELHRRSFLKRLLEVPV